jgi:hypothetical protein
MGGSVHDVFADAVSRVDFAGSMVRIELSSLRPPVAEGAAPRLEVTQRLVMPLAGFIEAVRTFQGLLTKLAPADAGADPLEAAISGPEAGSPASAQHDLPKKHIPAPESPQPVGRPISANFVD